MPSEDFSMALLPVIVNNLFKKVYSKIGDGDFQPPGQNDQGNNDDTTEQPSIPVPAKEDTSKVSYGDGGLSQRVKEILEGPDRYYAYEDEFWGGPVPSNLNQSLFGNMKAALQEASPYLGVFGSMLGIPRTVTKNVFGISPTANALSLAMSAPTTPIAPIAMVFGGMFGFENPTQTGIMREGLLDIYSKTSQISPDIKTKYGQTPEEFSKFMDNMFGTASNFDLQLGNQKAWEGITPEAKQLFEMVGLEATPERLLDIRTHAMDTARALSYDMYSKVNPDLVGFQDLHYLNTQVDWISNELNVYDVTKMNELGLKYGINPQDLKYSYAQNPEWTSIKLSQGDRESVAKSNVNLGYYDASMQATKDYKAGKITFEDWAKTQLDLKAEKDQKLKDLNNYGYNPSKPSPNNPTGGYSYGGGSVNMGLGGGDADRFGGGSGGKSSGGKSSGGGSKNVGDGGWDYGEPQGGYYR